MAETVPAAAPVKPAARMLTKNFGVSSYRYNRWSADLDETQTLEDALQPRFWIDQSALLMGHDKANPKGRGDIIEVRKPDTGLYAELLVMEIGIGFIKVQLIARAEGKDPPIPENSPLTPKWNPGKRAHDVIRKDTNQVMASGFQSKEAAAQWIVDHLKAMAA